MGNGTLFCAWLEEGDTGTHLFARWFDGEGQPLGTPLRVAIAGSTTWDLNAALGDDGAACVVFDANVGTGADEFFLARIEPRSAALHGEVVRLTRDDGFA